MAKSIFYSPNINICSWSQRKSLLHCPRCSSQYLHHTGIETFDREEDAERVVQTKILGGQVSINPAAPGTDNPSARRDGITIFFRCEDCEGEPPLNLHIAQHKGLTEIGWSYEIDD